MRVTTQLPVWLVAVLTVMPALITATAAVLTAWLSGTRKAGRADRATSLVDDERLVAVSVLDVLGNSGPAMLQPEDQGILDAVFTASMTEAVWLPNTLT